MLTLLTAITPLLLEVEEKAPTFAPPFVIAGIAGVVFAFLGFVTFSYRNVFNRQAPGRVPERHIEPIDEFGHAEEEH